MIKSIELFMVLIYFFSQFHLSKTHQIYKITETLFYLFHYVKQISFISFDDKMQKLFLFDEKSISKRV